MAEPQQIGEEQAASIIQSSKIRAIKNLSDKNRAFLQSALSAPSVMKALQRFSDAQTDVERTLERIKQKKYPNTDPSDIGVTYNREDGKLVSVVLENTINTASRSFTLMGDDQDFKEYAEAEARRSTVREDLEARILASAPSNDYTRNDVIKIRNLLTLDMLPAGDLKDHIKKTALENTNERKFEKVALRLSRVFGAEVSVSATKDLNGVPTFEIKVANDKAGAEAVIDSLIIARENAGIKGGPNGELPFRSDDKGNVKISGGDILNYGPGESDVKDELFQKLENNAAQFKKAIPEDYKVSSFDGLKLPPLELAGGTLTRSSPTGQSLPERLAGVNPNTGGPQQANSKEVGMT